MNTELVIDIARNSLDVYGEVEKNESSTSCRIGLIWETVCQFFKLSGEENYKYTKLLDPTALFIVKDPFLKYLAKSESHNDFLAFTATCRELSENRIHLLVKYSPEKLQNIFERAINYRERIWGFDVGDYVVGPRLDTFLQYFPSGTQHSSTPLKITFSSIEALNKIHTIFPNISLKFDKEFPRDFTESPTNNWIYRSVSCIQLRANYYGTPPYPNPREINVLLQQFSESNIQVLIFSKYEWHYYEDYSEIEFPASLKELHVINCLDDADLTYIAQKCPNLEALTSCEPHRTTPQGLQNAGFQKPITFLIHPKPPSILDYLGSCFF